MNVLVIDDETGPLNLFSEYLTDSGSSCAKVCEKALDAMEMVRTNRYDAVFMDINMPLKGKIKDGIGLAEELVKIDKSLKVFFVTGYSYDEIDIQKKLGDNLIKICHKPFTQEDVKDWFRLLKLSKESAQKIRIVTMGNFEVYVDGERIKFLSNKSKELLAYLVHHNGNIVERDETAQAIWSDTDRFADRLYGSLKNERYVLKKCLDKYNIGYIVTYEREKMKLNILPNMSCDSWDAIQQQKKYDCVDSNYLLSYDWHGVGGYYEHHLVRR